MPKKQQLIHPLPMQESIMGNKIRNMSVLLQKLFQQNKTEKLNQSPLQILPFRNSLTLTVTAVGDYLSLQI